MNFQVPQFLERESKIAGPLTFKQFFYLGAGGLAAFLLYFTLAAKNFFLFLVLAVIAVTSALAVAFINIGGFPLTTVLMNMIGFLFSPKLYLWQKKTFTPMIIKTEVKKEAARPEPPGSGLKMVERSQLKKLSTEIETGLK